jgi:tRNA G10  N-methylase Trm11
MEPASAHPLLLRCAPGLARTLQHEMKFRKLMERGARPLVVHQRNHDLVFLKNVVSAKELYAMRLAEDAGDCLLFGQYKVSPAQLERAATALRRIKKPLRLAVTADGSHFDRRDMERFMQRELKNRDVWLAEEGQMLWLFLIDEKFYLMLQTAHEDNAPLRHMRRREREGSLPPTIAAAMVFAARPAAGENILDPCCGSGTLLAEAYALQRDAAQLQGLDLDEEAVSAARANLKHAAPAVIRKGDGGATGLPDSTIDLVLANLPFGKRYGDTSTNPALYESLLREMIRTARRGSWRALLLTSDAVSLKTTLQQLPELKYEEAFTVKIRGETSRCWQVTFR